MPARCRRPVPRLFLSPNALVAPLLRPRRRVRAWGGRRTTEGDRTNTLAVGRAWYEDGEDYETASEGGLDDDVDVVGGDEEPERGFRLDSWALGGTVASTCAVVLIGVAEAPLYLLALPVVLPMVALLSYRERTRRRHRQELALALRSQQEVSAQVGLLLGQTSESSATVMASVSKLTEILARMETKVAASSEATIATQEAVGKSYNQLAKLTKASTNHILREQSKTLQRVVSEELAEAALGTDGDQAEAIERSIESNLAAVKRELIELESVQMDVLRSVEGLQVQEAAPVSADFSGGNLEVLREDLAAMREGLAMDVEDAVARASTSESRPASNPAALEELLQELRRVAEDNQRALQDLQDTLYAAAEVREAEGAEGDESRYLDEVREVGSSVDSLMESMEALQALPEVVETLAREVKADLRSLEVLSGGGAAIMTNKQEVSTSSTSIFASGGSFSDLEQKIDNLTRAMDIFEQLSSQLSRSGMDPQRSAGAGAGAGQGTFLPEGVSAQKMEDVMEAEVGERELESVVAGEARGGRTMEAEASEPAEAETGDEAARDIEVSAPIEEREEEEASMTAEELLGEGLALLRSGREDPQDSEAEACLRDALECFDRAIDLEPDYLAAHGNKGNTLMTLAKLVGEEGEASVMLVQAGRCFRRVLAIQPRDSRALMNWGAALVLRAKMAEDAEAEDALIDAAEEKFEAARLLGNAEAERAIQSLSSSGGR